MRDLNENYKAVSLIQPAALAATLTGTAVDVEVYNDDCMVIANLGALTNGASVVVTVTGSLVATPTTYDQTLVTFAAATANGIGAGRANLAGIKNIKGVATITGGSTTNISVVALVDNFANASGTNSLTIA